MMKNIQDPIGALWLMCHANFKTFLPLPVISGIDKHRQTIHDSTTQSRIELYKEALRPDDTPIAHLLFHLRYEIPHFEFLTRLFQHIDKQLIQDWVNREPSGQYARRAAFLYEFLTGDTLTPPSKLAGNYINVIDDTKLVSASPEHIRKNARWRVNDNIAGTAHFCPTIVKTEAYQQATQLNIPQLLDTLNQEVGSELLLRAASWFTIGESKSSFKIEGESDKTQRIHRFAHVMEQFTGQVNLLQDLPRLQAEILGEDTIIKQFGIRQSPVFIGKTRHFQEVVHYIAPPAQGLYDKLLGLQTFWEHTQGQSTVMRSAVVAFGFVYIHPLADGNGRVHRLLFNDLLRQDGMTQAPIILPISGVIAQDSNERIAYTQILDMISKPLMQSLEGQYSFSRKETLYPDGIYANLNIEKIEMAEPIWRHPDLSQHVNYFARVVQQTINVNMREESYYLYQHDLAREGIKNIIEMPNTYIDRIIRSVQDNNSVLSNKLAKEYTFLQKEGIWEQIVEVVRAAFHQ